MEFNFNPEDRISPELERQLVAPNAGENFRRVQREQRERRAKEPPKAEAPNNTPEPEPAQTK